MKVTSSCSIFATPWLYSPWNSPVQNTGVGSHSLLQGIFPTHESNPGLLLCRQILYQLSYKGSPSSSLLMSNVDTITRAIICIRSLNIEWLIMVSKHRRLNRADTRCTKTMPCVTLPHGKQQR